MTFKLFKNFKLQIKNYPRYVFVLAVLAVVAMLGFRLFSKTVAAAWWDDSWTFRKAFEISNHTGAETNVYLNITGAGVLDTSTATGIGNQLQSDCGDLRFTDYAGKLLPYFLVSGCLTSNTTVHVFMQNFPAGAQTIYIYYGNPGVANGTVATDFPVAATGVTLGSAGSAEVAQGPVAYWKMDEGTGNTAHSSTGSDLPGTLSGATLPSWQSDDMCVSGKCLFFDGSTSHVAVTDPGTNSVLDFDSGNTISLSVWFRPNTLPGLGNSMSLLTKGGSDGTDDANYLMSISNNGGNYTVNFGYTRVGFGGSGGWDVYETNKSLVQANIWQHVVVTYTYSTGSSIKLYYNGILQSGAWHACGGCGGNTAPTVTNKELWVGADDQSGCAGVCEPFSGRIDDFKIYRYARSATQILLDYNSKGSAGAKGSGSVFGAQTTDALNQGLLGYWKMDDNVSGNSKTLVDASGNGNTATTHYGANASGMDCTVPGKFGYSCFFDSVDDYASVANTLSGVQTVAFWASPSAQTVANFMDLNGTANISSASGAVTTTNITGARVFVNGTETTTLPNAMQWQHIVVTSTSGISASAITLAKIGSGFYGGRLDEVRMYNRILSPAEVQQLYNFAPGPVGYWNFEEGQGTAVNDSSGNGNNGSWNGTGGHWDEGKYGKAGSFDGSDDYVSFGNPANLQISNSFTLTAWVKASAFTAGNDNDITSKDAASQTAGNWNYSLFSTVDNGPRQFAVLAAKDATTYAVRYSNTTVTAGQWYFIAGVYDSAARTLNFYLNGVGDNGTLLNAVPSSINSGSTANVRIGRRQGGSANTFWNGRIDDAKIYNYPRTQAQIVQDMNGGHPAPGSPIASPAIYYKFDEGTGTTAYDNGYIRSNGGRPGGGLLTYRPDGKFGWAVKDNVDGGVASFLDGLSAMTVSFWINPDNLVVNSDITGKGSTDNHVFLISTDGTTASEINVSIASSLTDNTFANYFKTSGLELAKGLWQHLTIVYDGTQAAASRVKVYKNGLAVSGSVTGTLPATMTSGSTANLRIGVIQNGASNGALSAFYDEYKLFTFPLTPSQINEEFDMGSGITLGSFSDTSKLTGGSVASNSAGALFCVPGDSSSCNFPLHWWTLDENSGTTVNDLNPNSGLQGTLGTASTWSPGKIGRALSFSGGSGVATFIHGADASLGLNGATKATWMAWVRRRNVNSTMTLGDQGGAACNNGMTLVESGASGELHSAVTGNTGCVSGGFTSNDANWHHVAFVYDGTKSGDANKLIGYLDGVQQNLSFAYYSGATSIATSLSDSGPGGAGFEMGDCGLSCGEYTDGWIDEVRVYDYARTPAQIAWDFNRGQPQSWWMFDECAGTVAHDSVGTVSGTLNGGTAGDCNTNSTAWKDGISGKHNYSLSFGSAPDLTTVTSANTYPLSVTVVPASWGGWFKAASFVSQGLIDKVNQFRLYTNSSSKAVCGIFNGGAYVDATASTISLTANAWNHVICTYDGANIRTYVNGVLSGTTANGNGISVATSNLKVGSANSLTLTGQADDVKVWLYPLTAVQVGLDVNQGSAFRTGPAAGAP